MSSKPVFSEPSLLSSYGWDAGWEADFASHADSGLVPARVVGVDRGRCDVVTEAGPLRAGTSLLAVSDSVAAPCTGDWAALRPGTDPELLDLLPRRTVVVRAASGRTSQGQALAANVDTVAVVVSLAAQLRLGRIERLLALAWETGATPVVVLTKADQAADPAMATAEVEQLAPGLRVVATSATAGTGLESLTGVLTGTVVLLGPSGVGKSTLGNALLGADLLATGAVRAQDGKGRHTTVRRELVPLPGGGVLIDTPGLREIGLYDADEGLQQVFAEIEELAAACRFNDCAHDTEPECAVRAAIDSGQLTQRRLDSYRKLLRENAWSAARNDTRLQHEREKKWKAITKFQRDFYANRERR